MPCELVGILHYWIDHNKSISFSKKINLLIEYELVLISKFPESGKPTDISNVRVKIIQNYLLYYEVVESSLYVLTIRHVRKSQETLKIK